MATLILLCVVGFQQPPTAPPPALPPRAEVRCTDGSTVRVEVLQEALEVQTRYGKLTVPFADVRKLELGLHYPEGMPERVQAAVQKLGSKSHREREAASEELVAMGEYAYPAVHAAAKSTDLEVQERAKQVVAKLRERVPAERLQSDPQDRVETAVFVVVGRITSPSLKARAGIFGDVTLRLSDVRSLRRLDTPGASEVVVDAAKHGPTLTWLDTGIDIDADARLLLSASGQVDLWPATPGQYTVGPAGFAQASGGITKPGALLAHLGDSSKAFVVGERYEGAAGKGRLFLGIAPNGWNSASAGQFTVKISTDLGR